jgi:hypothetical protein
MLDQWATVPGDRLPHFMEKAIRENSYVLIICTPKYKEKSDKSSTVIDAACMKAAGESQTQTATPDFSEGIEGAI